MKAFAALTLAMVFLAGTICAVACPELFIRQTHCHNETKQSDDARKSADDDCLRTALLLSPKSFTDGFVLPSVAIAVPLPEPAIPIVPHTSVSIPSWVSLRTVVLRI